MRIAYIGIKGLPSKAGADRVVDAIVRRLASRYDTSVYCNKRTTAKNVEGLSGVKLILIPTLPGKYLQPISLLLFSCLHALFKGNYDLIHIHNAEACFIVPFLRLKYKVIATSHGPAYARAKWGTISKQLIHLVDDFFGKFPHLLTSVSLPLANEYQDRYHRLVHYIPNGVEELPTEGDEVVTSLLHEHHIVGDYILFAAGRMDPTKGCHLLLEAFKLIPSDKKLVVIGDMSTLPSYGDKLKTMADERVVFMPFISSKAKLFDIVRNAHLFVFPSTVEAMSMMLLEVASLGVPIVCSDIPENTSVLGKHSVYFNSSDVPDLVVKLKWALDNSQAMQQLAASAQEWVVTQYDWDNIVEQYAQQYDQLYYEETSK